MGWPNMLVLVRHAESEGNLRSADERAQFEMATYAYALTPRGRRQAEKTKEYLQLYFGGNNKYDLSLFFDVRYASYYERSRETLQIILPSAKFYEPPRLYEDPRLAEAQRGIYHTMTNDQIEERFPGELARKAREGLYHYRPLGGENWPDVELRIHSFLGTLSRDCDGKNVIMVVHGHWLILFQRLIHHFSIAEAIAKYKAGVFENASVTIYQSSPVAGCHPRLELVEENIVPWKGLI